MEITLGVVDRSILRADGRDPARFSKSLDHSSTEDPFNPSLPQHSRPDSRRDRGLSSSATLRSSPRASRRAPVVLEMPAFGGVRKKVDANVHFQKPDILAPYADIRQTWARSSRRDQSRLYNRRLINTSYGRRSRAYMISNLRPRHIRVRLRRS
jgi:hypothetical protein